MLIEITRKDIYNILIYTICYLNIYKSNLFFYLLTSQQIQRYYIKTAGITCYGNPGCRLKHE
ncbi:hypothetical protein M086_3092 [Bacteroides fragilis str. S13 L11]|nr:hypothetical protein M101_3490 [Bacteroides fragilis str. 1007-1-F \